jgi:hypothetical protein
MIHYVLHKDLDIAKYNQCITNSYNRLLYANSWYLDCVAQNWDVLVLNDFEAVMPLPIRKKYGIGYIFVPPWSQQLGVFSQKKIHQDVMEAFLTAIPKKYKLIDVLFNSENYFQSKYWTKRDNYILPLNKSYENLYKDFSKGRKSSIKQAANIDLSIRQVTSAEALIQLFKVNKGLELNRSDADLKVLQELVLKGFSLQKINVLEVISSKNKLLGGAIFLLDSNRITYLFSALNLEGREKQAMSFLIDFMIRKYANQSICFDFEGSMKYEIASFYRSFGAQLEPYYHFRRKRFF